VSYAALATVTGLDVSQASNILKNYYLGPVRDQLNEGIWALKTFGSRGASWSGQQVVGVIRTGRNVTSGWRADRGPLPPPGRQGYNQFIINSKYFYFRIELTGPVIAAARSNAGTFVQQVEGEVRGAIIDARENANRTFWGFGKGVLCLINEVAPADITVAGRTIEVDSPYGVAEQSSAGTKAGTRLLKVGMLLDVVQGGTSTLRNVAAGQYVEVVSIQDNDTFTGKAISSDVTGLADDDEFVIVDSLDNESMGLLGITDGLDSTSTHKYVDQLQNITGSTVPQWNGNILDAGGVGRPFVSTMFSDAFTAIERISGFDVTGNDYCIVVDYDIRNAYGRELAPDRRYMNVPRGGGWGGELRYPDDKTGVPIIAEKHVPFNTIFVLHKPSIVFLKQSEWEWANRDGAILRNRVGYDVWEAFGYMYGNLACDRRNTHARVEDVLQVIPTAYPR